MAVVHEHQALASSARPPPTHCLCAPPLRCTLLALSLAPTHAPIRPSTVCIPRTSTARRTQACMLMAVVPKHPCNTAPATHMASKHPAPATHLMAVVREHQTLASSAFVPAPATHSLPLHAPALFAPGSHFRSPACAAPPQHRLHHAPEHGCAALYVDGRAL